MHCRSIRVDEEDGGGGRTSSLMMIAAAVTSSTRFANVTRHGALVRDVGNAAEAAAGGKWLRRSACQSGQMLHLLISKVDAQTRSSSEATSKTAGSCNQSVARKCGATAAADVIVVLVLIEGGDGSSNHVSAEI